MDMTREIRIEEGKLKVVFEIQENGVVELKQFDSAGRMDVKERDRGEEDFYPITEVQITGRGTRGMHAYKHNVSGGATDFVYQSHEVLENEKGKELTADGDYVDRDINEEKLDSQEVFYETAYKNAEKK